MDEDPTAQALLKQLGAGVPIDARVVVVVAHPDDETIGPGSRLAHLERGVLIHITDGAPLDMEDARRIGIHDRAAYAAVRRAECDAALLALNASRLRRIAYDLPDKTVVDHLPRLIDRLTRELAEVDAVLTHAYEGGHPDHDACALAVQAACARLTRPPARLEFASYHQADGRMVPNRFHPDPDRPEIAVELSPSERARKAAALAAHATQAEVTVQFPPTREAYRQAPTYDFTRPPPPGACLYDGFGWALTSAAWRGKARAATVLSHARPRAPPTVLSVAYPFAPVDADPVGGAEQVLSRLDRALVARGWRSRVVALEGSQVAGELIGVPRPGAVIDEAFRARAHAAVRAALTSEVEAGDVDLIHLHGVDFADYMPPPGPPTLATLHLPIEWYAHAALRPGRPDTHLLPVSAAQAATAPPGLRLLAPIENGVDLDGYPEVERGDYALVLGRVCAEKGFHLALNAAHAADVPLVLAGEVFAYEAHQRYFAEAVAPRLDTRRRWVGAVRGAEKRALLAAARCVLIPSLAETSSLVAREALAAGTPVIAFRLSALVEVIEDGVTGFLVDDADEMAAAILWVGKIDPEACRRAARARFSPERMVDAYLELYRRLIAGEAAR